MHEATYRLGTCPLLGTYLVNSMYMNKLLTHNMTFDLLESPQTTKLLHYLRKFVVCISLVKRVLSVTSLVLADGRVVSVVVVNE